MCNLYAQTKSQDAMRQVFRGVLEDGEDLIDTAGNLAPASGIFPDYAAPIIPRGEGRDWTLTTARWGMPTPPVYLAGQAHRPRRHKYPQCQLTPLAQMAWRGTSLSRSIHQLFRTRRSTQCASQSPGLVCPWPGSTSRLLRRDPHRMDFGQKAEGGRGDN